MKMKWIVWAAVLTLSLFLAGCRYKEVKPASGEENGYRFTDALGEEVTVHDPKRVVALMGSFAETWLEAGGELAGVTDDALEERGISLGEDVVSVGKFNGPNMEKIIGLDPDLVILSSVTKEHVALKNALKQAGIPAVYFRVTNFEDYLSMLKACTEITGRSDLYEKNGLDIQKQIKDTISSVKDEKSPSILLLITYSGGAAVQNSDTMTGKMLKDLGCENIADKNRSLLKEFNMESIIKEDPDFIFVVPMGNDQELAMKNRKEAIENNPAWKGLTAVKDGRYILLPKEKFLYKPNAKWGESYTYLSEILYGKK